MNDIEFCGNGIHLGRLFSRATIHRITRQPLWVIVVPKVASRNLKKNAWNRETVEEAVELTELHLTLAIAKILPKHPNVAPLLGLFETDTFFYCVTERNENHCPLKEFIASSRSSISETTLFSILHQLLSAVSFFHKHLIWHSELTIDSVFIDPSTFHIQIHHVGISLLHNFESNASSHLYASKGCFRSLSENFTSDLIQIGHIILSMVVTRDGQETILPSLHDDVTSTSELFYDLPVSSKLKHLLLRIVTGRTKVGFGIQDVISHPWYRSQLAVQTHYNPNTDIIQAFNYNNPIRHPDGRLLASIGFLGNVKAISKALASREVLFSFFIFYLLF
jgi:serine/threonine protein kinase